MHRTLAKTVRRLDQMLASYFLEYLVLIANLLKLLRSPVLVDIDHFQRVQVRSVLLAHCIHFAERPFAQKLQYLKFLDPYALLLTTALL
jgi:hypothetical protein